ncbi:hypothetical protein VIGAN_07141700 [Vigna angularis var. angularis]|uniref:Uncharacterized protein n=1 Tax=Vigna angularis var. angularis TaxID=157739 RepID=A0A0S3SIJ1_PHAAN|nr:hypothetical protein VIGAN_07141700 [Vigna angularis var. angularis]
MPLPLSLSAFFFAFLRPLWDWDPPCSNRTPTSVRVLWDHRPTAHHDPPLHHRHKVIAFVGIQTGFGSVGRRQSLKNTWFPSDPHALQGFNLSFFIYFLFFAMFVFRQNLSIDSLR